MSASYLDSSILCDLIAFYGAIFIKPYHFKKIIEMQLITSYGDQAWTARGSRDINLVVTIMVRAYIITFI